MKESYEVTLDPKGEVVKYRVDVDVYYFSLRLKKWKWIVYLPATKGGAPSTLRINRGGTKNHISPHPQLFGRNKIFHMVRTISGGLGTRRPIRQR